MNVLSLFDGMSCGQLALNRVGISYENYFASEIDKYAIKVTQTHFPETIQLGDVRQVSGAELPKIDLLLAGSPCQGFSFAGKQLNFDDPRSKLFFEFVRILKECNPKYFLLENVNMKQEFQDVITEYLGVEPERINSSGFSAQDRLRLYWTNIPKLSYRKSELTVEDILEQEVSEKYNILPENAEVIVNNDVKKRKIAYIGRDSQGYRIYNIHGKSISLNSDSGGKARCTGMYALPCITPGRLTKRQNGRRFKPAGSKFYTLTAQDIHGILTNNFIRTLTPKECERLQTVPDDYTACAGSDHQRYKMLGNGWTVDVIVHILKGIIENEKKLRSV